MRRGTRLLAAASAAAALAGLLPVAAGAHDADKQRLAEARRKIQVVEAELKTGRSRELSAAERLRQADAQLARLEAAVNEVGAALLRQEQAVDEAARRVADLERRIDEQAAAFAVRAVELYKRGVGAPFAAVLEAGSIADAIDRSAYVQALSSSDRANVQRLAALRTTIAAERRRLEHARADLVGMKREREELYAKVAALRRTRALQLAAARADVADLERQRDDLQAESRGIARLIKEREAAARRAAAAQRAGQRYRRGAAQVVRDVSRSGYAWPRCDTVTSEYGWRWGRMHEGIDVDGDTGDPIYAAKDGVVIFSGWQGGYGRLVLVDHGDGIVTAYAHQSAFGVRDGERVSRGERIGSVGSTGNSTGPHLHFETRVHGDAVNPRRFLPSSC